MDLNTPMRYVMVRARLEAEASGYWEVYPEHVFLGLLKLSELNCEDFAPDSRHIEQHNQDIKNVRTALEAAKINAYMARPQIRQALRMERIPGNAGLNMEMLWAEIVKTLTGGVVTATNVLTAMLNAPTPIIRALFKLGGNDKKDKNDKKDNKEGKKDGDKEKVPKVAGREENISALAELTDKIGVMRYSLIAKVRGQDHAVHAFADGIFNAEVVAQADGNRKSPKAIFVFAGPPGVGKTFLANQAAEMLKIPFKSFEMTGYSDHQAHVNLIGANPTYKSAGSGTLTNFVKNNPKCILLFEEIEKAHLNTIHLFLQVLDSGVLHDDYYDEDVIFKDAIIIFTTNAGKRLYEGGYKSNAAGLTRQVILNALETDRHPQTDRPFFPPALCSRIATGYPIMFNHLQAHHLEEIVTGEIGRMSELFETQYGFKIQADAYLALTLLFSEGGLSDARTVRAQTEAFLKTELFKLCRLWDKNNFEAALINLEKIRFIVEVNKLPDDVKFLYKKPEKQKILFFGAGDFAEKMREKLTDYEIYGTNNIDEALKILGEYDIDLILLEFANHGLNFSGGTMRVFDNIPIASSDINSVRKVLGLIRERFEDLPVYLLESENFEIDGELLFSFLQKGARGKISRPDKDFGVFAEDIATICLQSHMQNIAAVLAAEQKALTFETAPMLSSDRKEAVVRLRELSLGRNVRAEDSANIIDEAEKPKTRFSDVIGARDAKDELMFFVEFLKNPKKLTAQGLKLPKGVLLYGPPGTGKTLLARAMAGESNVAFIPAAASGFVTKWQGSGPESIRSLFNQARRYAPSIIFIDEIDAIGRARRGGGGSGHGEEMALNALLNEMDGFSVDPKRPVFVLAATNFEVEEGKGRMGVIDEALSRRFDRKILVDLPNKDDRKLYLEIMIKKYINNTVTPLMTERLAERSAGLSLAHLALVLEMAGRAAVKKGVFVNDDILEEAFELNSHGEKKEWGHDYLERVARHEAGHAYLYWLTGNTPAYLTIVARGDHGGYMEHSVDKTAPLRTKDELLGSIRTSLGGRAAEIVYYGEKNGMSSGASGDLQNATNIARTMICSYGMDDEIGMVYIPQDDSLKGAFGEKIASRIAGIIKEQLELAKQSVADGRGKIDALAGELLKKNKMSKEEIEWVLGEE